MIKIIKDGQKKFHQWKMGADEGWRNGHRRVYLR